MSWRFNCGICYYSVYAWLGRSSLANVGTLFFLRGQGEEDKPPPPNSSSQSTRDTHTLYSVPFIVDLPGWQRWAIYPVPRGFIVQVWETHPSWSSSLRSLLQEGLEWGTRRSQRRRDFISMNFCRKFYLQSDILLLLYWVMSTHGYLGGFDCLHICIL